MLKVMLVDDERVAKRSMRALIETELSGFCIAAEASDGESALQAAELHRPDIVITDIRMPGMDGLALIRELGERKHTAEFIIVSGYGDFSYAQKALRFGVTDYLLKPIDSDYFLSVMHTVRDRLMRRTAANFDYTADEDGAAGQPKHPMMKEALALIAQRYADPEFSLKQVSDHFGISPNYFSTLFKRSMGVSFIQYLVQVRVKEAKRYLQKPFIKVYEIGHFVGFEDYTHFSKTFKKLNGCSPTEYRKTIESGE